MQQLYVTGGKPLYGSVRIGGAKNASYKIMIAALLASTESRILNFSRIKDVETVGDIINYLGGTVKKAGDRSLFVNPQGLVGFTLNAKDGKQGRFSNMFIPPLLHKFGKAVVPAPGGDKIGKRPLDRHFDGLRALGATVEYRNGHFHASAEKLVGTTYTFSKSTHTGTETMIMAGCLAEGQTILHNAALEPEIDDLITFLNAMGADITRTKDRTITINGVKVLHGAIHKLLPDRNEAVSYACAALATKGDVVIENAVTRHLHSFLDLVEQIGGSYEVGSYGIRFFVTKPLTATDIITLPEPGIMTDWQPLIASVLTQCEGTSTIHETVMANRFQYADELNQMGAKTELYNPEVTDPENLYNFDVKNDQPEYYHGLKIHGPTPLKPATITVKDLRHGATLLIAALTASGTSTFTNLSEIDRGYENIDAKLRDLGADIVRK